MRAVSFVIGIFASVLLAGGVTLVAAQPKKVAQVAKPATAREIPFRHIEDLDKIGQLRGSKLVGSTVKDAAGKNIGKIEDVIVDASGRVESAVLSFGGIFGMGEKLYAIPWSAMRLERDEKNNVTVMLDNVKKETLDKAPRYEARSPGRARSDSAITADVKSKLASEKLSSLIKVNVDTQGGVVHLRGTVASEQIKQRAGEVAREVDGVRDIKNDLRVSG